MRTNIRFCFIVANINFHSKFLVEWCGMDFGLAARPPRNAEYFRCSCVGARFANVATLKFLSYIGTICTSFRFCVISLKRSEFAGGKPYFGGKHSFKWNALLMANLKNISCNFSLQKLFKVHWLLNAISCWRNVGQTFSMLSLTS